MATNKRHPSGARARAPKAAPPADDLDLGMGEDELEALFAQALESTSRKVRVPRPAPPEDDFDLDDLNIGDEDSIHIHIDETEDVREDIARLFGSTATDPGIDDGDLVLPALGAFDDELDDDLPEADEILATLDGLEPVAPPQEDEEDFDELDRELQAALADEDDAEDGLLQAAMEKLLAESYGVTASNAEDISLPEIPVEDGDHEILALGDDGAMSVGDLKDAELASLRAQVAELGRSLTIKDLEIRTQEDRIDGLEQQVVAATRQSAGIGREFESFRRRVEREKDDLKKFAAEKVLKEFLVVFDNLDRAIQHAGDDRSTGLGQGVVMILGQFKSALRRCGVNEVPSGVGEIFDPQWHEAVGQEFSDTVESGGIANQLVAGFELNGRLLRAAMVSVSRGPAPAPEPADAEADAPQEAAAEDAEAPEAESKPSKKKRTRKASTKSKSTRKRKTRAAKKEAVEVAEAEPDATETVTDAPAASGEDAAGDGETEPAPPKKKRRRRKKAPATEAEE